MTTEAVVKTLVDYLMEDFAPCEIFQQMNYLRDTVCDEDCAKCILKHLKKENKEE